MWAIILGSTLLAAAPVEGEARLKVDAGQVLHRISPLLSGACIEDVNHEIYGGLYSQMIFGESFQEPPSTIPIEGFATFGGRWTEVGDELRVEAGDGPKLVWGGSPVGGDVTSVDVRLPTDRGGNAGLILHVANPGIGADAWTGYEVSLETAGRLVLGRHRRNWEPIRSVPCAVPVDRWVNLAVQVRGASLEISVDGKLVLTFEDRDHPLKPGRIGLRNFRRPAQFRNLLVGTKAVPFRLAPSDPLASGVSGMWRPVRRGDARGELAIEATRPFQGRQSQRITLAEGQGEIGIENRGLNRWGLNLVAGKPYEGVVWARAEQPTEVALALETGDGGRILGSTTIQVTGSEWARYPFALTPAEADRAGRFAVKLAQAGSVAVGYVFLQPGDWGRYKGLPVRRDVAEGLLDQGVTVLRYGGSMVNHPEYLWKRMIGPRDQRPPSAGWWYPYSSNGWGIPDFLDFTEALGIVGIPAFHMGESAQDMVDFVEYANGPADSPWGRKRVEDGHPTPYKLKQVELGNEEKVDAAYWAKFRPMVEAIWAKDPEIIVVVGDFLYHQVITDPAHIAGSAGADSLNVHRQILELARERGREVWFDIHTSTDHPPEPNGLLPERSYVDQLGKLAPGARFKVAVFEYNSGNHSMKRALSNALATNEVERVGDLLPIACAANCLQPDGQNDNGWDQGLLFLNPGQVWLQPPGHLIRMTRRLGQPLLVRSELEGATEKLSVNAKRSLDGRTLVLQVVNWDDAPRPTRIELLGFTPTNPVATIEQMAAPLEATNTADEPTRVVPILSEYRLDWSAGRSSYTFAPRSITMLQLK